MSEEEPDAKRLTNQEAFDLGAGGWINPGRRPVWGVTPSKTTSAMAYAPTAADRMAEEMDQVKVAANGGADPEGLGLYGEEGMDAVVARQDRRWRRG